jgi:hypothetical protein
MFCFVCLYVSVFCYVLFCLFVCFCVLFCFVLFVCMFLGLFVVFFNILFNFFFVLCPGCPMLPASLDCSFLTAPSVFSNVYLPSNTAFPVRLPSKISDFDLYINIGFD